MEDIRTADADVTVEHDAEQVQAERPDLDQTDDTQTKPKPVDKKLSPKDIVYQILQFVKQNSYRDAIELITSSTDLDMSRVDNLGKTALHYAASEGNLDMTRLLFARNTPINTADKTGQTALHYAAVRGNDHVIHELVIHGAYIDFPDTVKGRTALHFAAFKSRLDTIKLLLFCGADTTVVDKEGKSPSDLSKSEPVKKTLEKAGERNRGQIQLDSATLTPESPRQQLKRTGARVSCDSFADDIRVSVLFRRWPVEQANSEFNIREEEDECSDVFAFKVVTALRSGLPTTLTLPIFSAPDITEELVAKMEGTDVVLPVTDVTMEGKHWMGSIKADLTTFTSLIVVCRPKKETFRIGMDAVTVTSSVEEGFELDIPAKTFKTPVTLSISVMEPPSDEQIETEQLDDVISVSSFYSIDAGGEMPDQSINVKIPLPTHYTGKGSVVILSMDDDADDETEESWKILYTDAKVDGDRVTFDISRFSVKVATETNSLKSVANELKLKREVSWLFKKSRRREYQVSFLSMTKPLGDIYSFKVAVECCLTDNLSSRLTYWTSEGYDDQRPSQSATSTMRTKQRLRIGVTDSIRMQGNSKCIPLEFHPRRDNHVTFHSEIVEHAKVGTGHVEITLLELIKGQEADMALEEETGSLVATIPIQLQQVGRKEKKPTKKEQENTQATDNNIQEFFDNKLLDEIFSQVEDEDWYRIFLLMGVSFKDIEFKLAEPGNIRKKINQMAVAWRDAAKKEAHQGIPVILSSFFKGGRRDLAATLQIRLREWYKDADSNSVFYRWVTKAYRDDNVLVPANYAEPMSDPFLVHLADDILPTRNLADALRMKADDFGTVQGSSLYTCDGLKTLKFLTVFRDEAGDVVSGLDGLARALVKLGLAEATKNIVMCTRAWLKRYHIKDKLRNDVGKWLKEFDK